MGLHTLAQANGPGELRKQLNVCALKGRTTPNRAILAADVTPFLPAGNDSDN